MRKMEDDEFYLSREVHTCHVSDKINITLEYLLPGTYTKEMLKKHVDANVNNFIRDALDESYSLYLKRKEANKINTTILPKSSFRVIDFILSMDSKMVLVTVGV